MHCSPSKNCKIGGLSSFTNFAKYVIHPVLGRLFDLCTNCTQWCVYWPRLLTLQKFFGYTVHDSLFLWKMHAQHLPHQNYLSERIKGSKKFYLMGLSESRLSGPLAAAGKVRWLDLVVWFWDFVFTEIWPIVGLNIWDGSGVNTENNRALTLTSLLCLYSRPVSTRLWKSIFLVLTRLLVVVVSVSFVKVNKEACETAEEEGFPAILELMN